MNNTKLILTIIFTAILTLLSCGKDELDFGSGSFFDIQQVLESENCNVDCGEVADCEGRDVMVRGQLDQSNINETSNQFYLIDENDAAFRLEVRVDELVNEDVFDKLEGMGGEIFQVSGTLEGFDAQTNTSCERLFIMNVDDPENVELE